MCLTRNKSVRSEFLASNCFSGNRFFSILGLRERIKQLIYLRTTAKSFNNSPPNLRRVSIPEESLKLFINTRDPLDFIHELLCHKVQSLLNVRLRLCPNSLQVNIDCTPFNLITKNLRTCPPLLTSTFRKRFSVKIASTGAWSSVNWLIYGHIIHRSQEL